MIKIKEIWLSYFGEHSIGIWKSEKYFAAAFQDKNCIRLDIKRNDESDGMTWDELQKIKDNCGFADKDAIEFYPANDAVINTGNWRHLYIFNEQLPLIRR